MQRLGVVTMFRDEAPYLAEWIEYHRLAGVDHFWLYDNDSVDDGRAVLAPYVAEGLVEILPWSTPGRPPLASERDQMGALRDGLYRARRKVAWVAMIDVDEFILPMKDRTIPRCLERHFSDACGVYVNWRMFGTSAATIAPGDPILTELTACSLPSHPENNNGKSLVRPNQVDIDAAWYPHHFPLRHEARYFDGGLNELKRNGRDWRVHGEHFDAYIRINHYNLRDEHFFRTRRLPAAQQGALNKSLDRLLEHHESFGKARDRKIVDFLEEHHREAFRKIWK